MWRAGATLHRGARASHCRSLSLRSTDSRRAGSVVVAHGLSCSAACGILPDQGSNPCPLHRQADSQPLHHQGSPIFLFLKLILYLIYLVSISTEFLFNFQQQKNIVLNELKFTSPPPKRSKASLKSGKLSNIQVYTSKNKFTTAFPCKNKK